jgi:molecular chaperone DnaJ
LVVFQVSVRQQRFLQLAQQYHPDRNKDPGAADKFKEIAAAYDVLRDDDKRKQYDSFGHDAYAAAGSGGPGGPTGAQRGAAYENVNIEDLLREFGFGGGAQRGGGGGGGNPFGFGGWQRQSAGASAAQRGNDYEVPLSLSFMEAAKGCEKDVTFDAVIKCGTCKGVGAAPGATMQPCKSCGGSGQRVQSSGLFAFATSCESCDGTGKVPTKKCGECSGEGVKPERRTVRVKVPAGVDDGVNIRLASQGEAGRRGGQSGHLYITLKVAAHPVFTRQAFDVHLKAPITIGQAILGGKIRVPTLDGEVDVVIPRGTQPDEKRVLRGKGIQRVNSSGSGDLYVHFQVIVPTKLTPRQEQLLTEYAEAEDVAVKEQGSDGLFAKFKSYLKSHKP